MSVWYDKINNQIKGEFFSFAKTAAESFACPGFLPRSDLTLCNQIGRAIKLKRKLPCVTESGYAHGVSIVLWCMTSWIYGQPGLEKIIIDVLKSKDERGFFHFEREAIDNLYRHKYFERKKLFQISGMTPLPDRSQLVCTGRAIDPYFFDEDKLF